VRGFVGCSGVYDLSACAAHLHARGLYRSTLLAVMGAGDEAVARARRRRQGLSFVTPRAGATGADAPLLHASPAWHVRGLRAGIGGAPEADATADAAPARAPRSTGGRAASSSECTISASPPLRAGARGRPWAFPPTRRFRAPTRSVSPRC
jgi:hypothetical protein